MTFGHVGTEDIQLNNSEPAEVKGEGILSVVFIICLYIQNKLFEVDIILKTHGPPIPQAVCGPQEFYKTGRQKASVCDKRPYVTL
jgi:hypothetical protein